MSLILLVFYYLFNKKFKYPNKIKLYINKLWKFVIRKMILKFKLLSGIEVLLLIRELLEKLLHCMDLD
jgi:hypothetical protein